MKNKQIIKALTIGISANMLLNPVVAFAEELSDGDSKVTSDGDNVSEDEDNKLANTSQESAMNKWR